MSSVLVVVSLRACVNDALVCNGSSFVFVFPHVVFSHLPLQSRMNIELWIVIKLIIRLNLECGFVSSSGPIGNIDFSIMSAIIQWFFSKNIFSLPWNKEYRAIFCLLFTILFYFIFFSTGDVGNYYYGQGHPMKPHRIRMTHNLLLNYGLYRKMEIYVRNSSLLFIYIFFFFFHVFWLSQFLHSFACLAAS